MKLRKERENPISKEFVKSLFNMCENTLRFHLSKDPQDGDVQLLDPLVCPSHPLPLVPDPTTPSGDFDLMTWHDKRLQRIEELRPKPPNADCGKEALTLEWFQNLNATEPQFHKLYFPESLTVVNDAGTAVGKLISSIRRAQMNDIQGLVVHLESTTILNDGSQYGTSTTAFLDSHLKPVQEYTYEWIQSSEKRLHRTSLLIRENTSYFFKTCVDGTDICPKQTIRKFKIDEFDNVVTEAGNAVLQKFILAENRAGQLKLRTISVIGCLFNVTYTTLGSEQHTINMEPTTIRGIRRTVFQSSGADTWDAIYDSYGKLVLKTQPCSDYALTPLWFKPMVVEEPGSADENAEQGPVKRQLNPPLMWACDAHLFAQYSRYKDEAASESKAYLLRNPKIRALLADFAQSVLVSKPKSVVDFAHSFFLPYLKVHQGGDCH